MKKFETPQEEFWAGEFGTQYIGRNDSDELLASNLNFFAKALKNAGKISSCLEFGANIGMNLLALGLLYPNMKQEGIEINPDAAKRLANLIGSQNVFEGSIFDYDIIDPMVDLVLIKGVLIHTNPDKLPLIYDKLYEATSKFILVCEYYNPTPVTMTYRGHENRLFKRDFAGELMERHPDLNLVDYGFCYHRDIAFPMDDITWFLLKK
jgi:pseudaminic acid biosynthesis-associated methylase